MVLETRLVFSSYAISILLLLQWVNDPVEYFCLHCFTLRTCMKIWWSFRSYLCRNIEKYFSHSLTWSCVAAVVWSAWLSSQIGPPGTSLKGVTGHTKKAEGASWSASYLLYLHIKSISSKRLEVLWMITCAELWIQPTFYFIWTSCAACNICMCGPYLQQMYA